MVVLAYRESLVKRARTLSIVLLLLLAVQKRLVLWAYLDLLALPGANVTLALLALMAPVSQPRSALTASSRTIAEINSPVRD